MDSQIPLLNELSIVSTPMINIQFSNNKTTKKKPTPSWMVSFNRKKKAPQQQYQLTSLSSNDSVESL